MMKKHFPFDMEERFPTYQPLPSNPFIPNTLQYNAFQSCQNMERSHADDYSPMANGLVYALVHARFLGYLMSEIHPDGAHVVAEEVISCQNDEDLMKELSQFYIHNLVGLVTTNKTYDSIASKSDRTVGPLPDVADPAPRDRRTAKASALIRDNYRCVVSGDADQYSLTKMSREQLEKFNLTSGSDCRPTDHCSIFVPSINWNLVIDYPTQENKTRYSSLTKILSCFGLVDFDEIKKSTGYSLTNGLTLNVSLCSVFCELGLWFEYIPTVKGHPQPNTYQARSAYNLFDLRILPPGQNVTFTSTDPSLPLPNPKYLQFHAFLCRAVQLSGVGSLLLIESIDTEGVSALAHDGSSANILASRLAFLSLTG